MGLAAQLGRQALVAVKSRKQEIGRLLREGKLRQAPQDDPEQHIIHTFCLSQRRQGEAGLLPAAPRGRHQLVVGQRARGHRPAALADLSGEGLPLLAGRR